MIDGELRLRVTAAPVDGGTNVAVVRLIADALNVTRSAVRLVAGERGRRKVIGIEGVPASEVARRWPGVRT